MTVPRAAPMPADLASALGAAGDRLGAFRTVQYFPEVASTNDLATALASEGAAQGIAVLADEQHAGRGRRGRTWFSPAGSGLYLSAVVRPPDDGASLSLVTLAAGIAAALGVRRASGLPVELKWPNDLVVGRPWRKLGGVLCEAVGGSTVHAVVVGIGINVLATAFPRELADRATSIETELGREGDRGRVLAEVLCGLQEVTSHLATGADGRAWLCDAWRSLGKAGLGGAAVRWQDVDGTRRGSAMDIDDSGALLVDAGGVVARLVAGEVIWEQLSRT